MRQIVWTLAFWIVVALFFAVTEPKFRVEQWVALAFCATFNTWAVWRDQRDRRDDDDDQG